jgi:hypothetical protein
MSKGPYSVKKSDIVRALQAVDKNGRPYKVEIDVGRRVICLIPMTPGEASSSSSAATADEVLAQWRKERGHAHSG